MSGILWKKNDDNSDDDEQHANGEHSDMPRDSEDSRREPNERDRLLAGSNRSGSSRRQPNRDGYLDPDDPAVSPYNLWTVRAVRYLTIFFAYLTLIWWVLLLVSIFVSPPGLHTRGSGFTDFSFTTLSMGVLLCSLLFFSAPSRAMQVCQGIIALLLLVDMIIIVVVPKIRAEESPPGIASVVWATLVSIWCVATDRIVAWGKREEEERLTGRQERRRTFRGWLAVMLATVILVIYIIIALFMTATLIIRARDASLDYEGERYRVDDNKYEVHLACVGDVEKGPNGERAPTVLLEAGEDPLEYDFEYWVFNALENGTISRYCYWDRPGYGWSDSAPSPHSAGMSAENLATALAVKGEDGPWILVSAGYGSLVSRIFSARHDRSVKGIMMIDPMHEDLLYRIGGPGRGFMLWAWGVISPLGIRRIIGTLFNSQSREDRVYGKAAFMSGKYIKAKLQESLIAQSLTKSEVATARTIESPDTPLVVITSGVHAASDEEWNRKQQDLTKITDNLISWDVVNNATHNVWKTQKGRDIMEKRLGALVQEAYRKPNETRWDWPGSH